MASPPAEPRKRLCWHCTGEVSFINTCTSVQYMKIAPLLQRLQGLVPTAAATAAAVPAGQGIRDLVRHDLGRR